MAAAGAEGVAGLVVSTPDRETGGAQRDPVQLESLLSQRAAEKRHHLLVGVSRGFAVRPTTTGAGSEAAS